MLDHAVHFRVRCHALRLSYMKITMGDAAFTFRVDAALKAEFTTAAKSRDCSGAQLMREFMRDFVKQQHEASAHDVWFRREVQIGLEQPVPVKSLQPKPLKRKRAPGAKRRGAKWPPRVREIGVDAAGTTRSRRNPRIHRCRQPARRARSRYLAIQEEHAPGGSSRPWTAGPDTRHARAHRASQLQPDLRLAGGRVRVLRMLHATRMWPPNERR